MSLRAPQSGPGPRGEHIGELRLRRLRAGELTDSEAAELHRHLEACTTCRERQEELAIEERAFATAIPLPRFAGGVERAARVPRTMPRSRRRLLTGGAVGMAAAAGLLLFLRAAPMPDSDPWPSNRTKGADISASIRLAGPDGVQRSLDPGGATALRPGERLRIGYTAVAPGHLVAVSVDDAGVVTTLYPDGDRAPGAPAASSRTMSYLPGSFELTGAGRERVFLFSARRALSLAEAAAAVKRAHSTAGDLASMPSPQLAAEVVTFTWLFEKP